MAAARRKPKTIDAVAIDITEPDVESGRRREKTLDTTARGGLGINTDAMLLVRNATMAEAFIQLRSLWRHKTALEADLAVYSRVSQDGAAVGEAVAGVKGQLRGVEWEIDKIFRRWNHLPEDDREANGF